MKGVIIMSDKLDKLKVFGYYLLSKGKVFSMTFLECLPVIFALFGLAILYLIICLPYFEETVPQDVEHCEMQITSVEHGAYSNREYTIFTVESVQDTFYTLPKVSTNIVRTYNIGDTLPVILLENGEIRVDTNAVTSQ